MNYNCKFRSEKMVELVNKIYANIKITFGCQKLVGSGSFLNNVTMQKILSVFTDFYAKVNNDTIYSKHVITANMGLLMRKPTYTQRRARTPTRVHVTVSCFTRF